MPQFSRITALIVLLCVLAGGTLARALEDAFTQVLQSNAVATGVGTPVMVSRYSSVGVDTNIATTATVVYEIQAKDNGVWATAPCSPSSVTSVSGVAQCNVAGMNAFRARIAAWATGTVSVYARATTGVMGAVSSLAGNGSTITPLADTTVGGSATLIVAAEANRVALNCTNTSATVNVRWGSSSVAASTGQRIPFGTAIEIKSRGAVYMASEGANVTVACTKELE